LSSVKAIVFDMYETLVSNPESSWIELFKEICTKQDLLIDPETLYREWKEREIDFRRVRLNIEHPHKSPPFKSYEVAWKECFDQVFEMRRLNGDSSQAAKAAIYSMGIREPFEETHAALLTLQNNWTTAVLSNADDDYLFPQISRLGINFHTILSSEMVGAYKPHPMPFESILIKLDLLAHEVVYVGDNQFDDVKGSKGVGMRSVWINRYGKHPDSNLPSPDFEITSLTDLHKVIERWN